MSNWQRARLGDVCDTISDTYKGNSDNVVLINTSDVLEGKVLNHTKEPNKNLKGQFKKTFQLNDILYSEIRPQNRRYAFVDFDALNYIASTKLMVLRAKKIILPKYLYLLLSASETVQNLQAIAETRSGTFPQITYSELNNIEIDLPPLAEQERIAGILGALDDKIECNNRINRNLEEQAQALFRRWFVDFEFPDPNNDGKPYCSSGGSFIDSPLGKIPQGWVVGTLGDVMTPRKGKNLTRAQVVDGNIPVIAGGLTPSCFHNTENTTAPVITVSASGANAGYVWLHHKPIWSSDSSYIDKSITEYVYYAYVFLSYNQNKIYHKQQGCAQPHIYPSHLMELDLVIPTYDIIAKFEKVLEILFKQIGNKKDENQALAQLRDTLLPKLMNNEISVDELTQ